MLHVKILIFASFILNFTSCGSDIELKIADRHGSSNIMEPFISTWRVGDPSYGDGDNTVTLPLRSGYSYNFTVDWGDGNSAAITTYNDPDIDHTYASPGDYTITLTGTAEAWYFNNIGDKDKIISVTDFGNLGWINLQGAFYGCTNMTSFAGGNTASVTDMSSMFERTYDLTSLDLSSFDTASVTDMSSMFERTNFTSLDLSSFDTASVTDMSSMFYDTDLTSLDLSSFDTASVTDMSSMFFDTNLTSLDLTGFNITAITNSSDIFGEGIDDVVLCNDQDAVNDGTGTPGVGTIFGQNCN